MSIIEQAIGKSRARHVADRSQEAAAIDLAVRIRSQTLALDHQQCRERRLLLPGAADTDGAAVAAYRMLRTRLLHRARQKQWTTIAVTSAGPNDGKTLTALNLCFSMAREKSREIVLLDMDMRNPSVCRTLGVHPPTQLHEYLEHGADARGMFFSVSSNNLFIAGSTTATDQASELLASPRFDELIQCVKLGAVNPVILIDLPPVLLTDDALVVAPKVDATLIVASEGLTNRAALLKAMDLLAEFPIAGVVLNRAADASTGYGYGYGYGYGDIKRGASAETV